MPPQYSRSDSLREYLSGASLDGQPQTNPSLCFGNYRSSVEALSLAIVMGTPISGVSVLYAGGANPVGVGTLRAIDANNLTWQPSDATLQGPPAHFSGSSDTEIVEAYGNPGRYLRITGSTPFTPGSSTVTLTYLTDNVFGFDDVTISQASSGISQYRASIVRNEAAHSVINWQRWLATLASSQPSNGNWLSAGGAGTVVTNTGSFLAWPSTGWCQVRSSGGTLKEVVYYSQRTNTTLTVPATGRALLGTTATAGSNTDFVHSVPGVALAIDPAGAQASGSSIQTIANDTTAPVGVTWNKGITAGTGLQIGTLTAGQQVGIWMWRHIPANCISTPAALTEILDSFGAF